MGSILLPFQKPNGIATNVAVLLTLLPPLLSLLQEYAGRRLGVEIWSMILNVILLFVLLQREAHTTKHTRSVPVAELDANRSSQLSTVAQPASSTQVSPNALPETNTNPAPSLGDADPAVNLPVGVTLPHISEREDVELSLGKLVVHKGHLNGRKQGIAIQRINAPAAAVWERLLDFERWPRMISDCTSTRVYHSDEKIFKVEIVVSVAMLRIRSFVVHTYDAEHGVMTWSLDSHFDSDLVANSGFWHVRPDGPNCCTVFYSVAVGLQKWAPGWLDSFIAVQGLRKAISWLKRESEKTVARRVQSTGN